VVSAPVTSLSKNFAGDRGKTGSAVHSGEVKQGTACGLVNVKMQMR